MMNLQESISANAPAWNHVQVYDTVTSTNDLLRAQALQGAPEGSVIIARRQTAGKGRQGRSFYSPAETGLYLSLLLRPACPPEETLAITPMAAVATADTIESCCGASPQIKWVNDLLLHGKKVCGILAEAQMTAQDAPPDFVILGIGINLLPPKNGFPPEIAGIAGAVYPAGTDPEHAFADCSLALLHALYREYHTLPQKGYLARYKARLCVLHRPITVLESGIETPAEALAVDDRLRLLVQYPDGRQEWRATGEIRIRL